MKIRLINLIVWCGLVLMACAGPAVVTNPQSTTTTQTQTQTLTTTATRSYKIGDTGPAGGLIFYDKGNSSDGWRYLEAAPVSSEFKSEWGLKGTSVIGIETAIGTGKKNTSIIVEWSSDTAAGKCVALSVGGYKDWFLPSKDELNLMYKNLAENGQGQFAGKVYWASSQVNDRYACGQSFYNGIQLHGNNKAALGMVRAVRAF